MVLQRLLSEEHISFPPHMFVIKLPILNMRDFSAKVGREDIFKPTIGNESLHEISNDNGVRVVNFSTSKNQKYDVPTS
jgi:hypothetical protein